MQNVYICVQFWLNCYSEYVVSGIGLGQYTQVNDQMITKLVDGHFNNLFTMINPISCCSPNY